MNMYGEVKIKLHEFSTSVLVGGEWSTFIFWPLANLETDDMIILRILNGVKNKILVNIITDEDIFMKQFK